MALGSALLAQVLQTPRNKEVVALPIVRTIVLRDPANAAELVAALERPASLESYNARKILCRFSVDAVQPVVASLQTAGIEARRQGLDVLWALLAMERPSTIRQKLQSVKTGLVALLDDKSVFSSERPRHVEPDFYGRICDLAFIRIQMLLSPRFDQSRFRSLAFEGRDREIARLKQRDFGTML